MVMRTGNSQNAKANKKVREFLDEYFKTIPYGVVVTPEKICSLVNEDDHRRDYSSDRIGALLRERDGDDIIKTTDGWMRNPAVDDDNRQDVAIAC
ncbi:MAG: hypothetical protein M0Q91_13810 [Methanoregula sp.]|jgi:hypothetical protein|nr:hypothetical protein [Methanoregula sp.]